MIAVFLPSATAVAGVWPLGRLTLLVPVAVSVASMALVAGLGVAIGRVAYRPLRAAGRLSPLVSALGASVSSRGRR